MVKVPLNDKLKRIHNGYSVSPAHSEYLINQIVNTPILSVGRLKFDYCHDPSRLVLNKTKHKFLPHDIYETTYGDLAKVIVSSMSLPNRDMTELLKVEISTVIDADPTEYRHLQKEARDEVSAAQELSREYDDGLILMCQYLEIPFSEYRDYICTYDIHPRTKVYIDRMCKKLAISGRMHLYDTYRVLKDAINKRIESTLHGDPETYCPTLKDFLPFIEFLVKPLAAIASGRVPEAAIRRNHQRTRSINKKQTTFI